MSPIEKQIEDFLATRQRGRLRAITIRWSYSADIEIEVEGDLYDGETEAVKVIYELHEAFPGVLFDYCIHQAKPEAWWAARREKPDA
jgi:hypothetical protein